MFTCLLQLPAGGWGRRAGGCCCCCCCMPLWMHAECNSACAAEHNKRRACAAHIGQEQQRGRNLQVDEVAQCSPGVWQRELDADVVQVPVRTGTCISSAGGALHYVQITACACRSLEYRPRMACGRLHLHSMHAHTHLPRGSCTALGLLDALTGKHQRQGSKGLQISWRAEARTQR
jgi:hypothetical protein